MSYANDRQLQLMLLDRVWIDITIQLLSNYDDDAKMYIEKWNKICSIQLVDIVDKDIHSVYTRQVTKMVNSFN